MTLNYVPIAYPALVPAVIAIEPGRREFWRVLNASAETVMDFALTYDGVDQPLEVVGLDGVPIGSRGGATTGKVQTLHHILIPAAGRAEFIVAGPSETIAHASLVTRSIAMGPDGDNDIARPLARLVADPFDVKATPRTIPKPSHSAPPTRESPDALVRAPITARRKLFLSEVLADPYDPSTQPKYFITLDGATPRVFDPADPPAIVTSDAAVEEWTIENRSREMHEFHIHQIHFELEGRDGVRLPPETATGTWTRRRFHSGRERVLIPASPWRLDFRGVPAGDLLYHCHMLDHEDGGMMAIVRVLPRQVATR